MAARFWWLLRYLGRTQTFVLDGGFAAWAEAGHPVATSLPAPAPRTFEPDVQHEMLVSVDG